MSAAKWEARLSISGDRWVLVVPLRTQAALFTPRCVDAVGQKDEGVTARMPQRSLVVSVELILPEQAVTDVHVFTFQHADHRIRFRGDLALGVRTK